MTEILNQNKEIIYFILSISGIVLSFLIKFFMDWRNKICFDYISKRDVAINILQERFISGIIKYIENVINEKDSKNVSLEVIYKRPGHIKLISDLSKSGEEITKINNLYKLLELYSFTLLIISWVIFAILVSWLFLLILKLNNDFLNQTGIIITFLCVFLIIILVIFMFKNDQSFFKSVNKIIEPEIT